MALNNLKRVDMPLKKPNFTFMSHYISSSPARSKYLSFFSFFFLFLFLFLFSLCGLSGLQSPLFDSFSFFLLFFFFLFFINNQLVWSSGRDLMIRWYLKTCENFPRLILPDLFLLCIYHSVVWSNFSFLRNSQLITFLTQSC